MTDSMPIAETTGLSMIVLVTSLASSAGVALGIYDVDIAASIGAAIGTFVAVLEASSNERSLKHRVSVGLASMCVGCALPGAVIYFYFPSYVERLTWHAWGIAGFVASLFGWAITAGLLRISKNDSFLGSLVRFLARIVGVKLPSDANNTNDPTKKP